MATGFQNLDEEDDNTVIQDENVSGDDLDVENKIGDIQ